MHYLLATLIYFVYLRSVVDSCSSESNNDSNCDLESTDNWYFWSKKIEQVGVDSDDDIDSIENVS